MDKIMNKGINVLSLFDGISCGQIALQRAGIKVNNYFASEIDRHAIKVSEANYPAIIRLGDVTKWREWDLPEIDLLIAGSPCQGFSLSGKQLNFEDIRSKLFFEFVDILKHYKPKYFLLENVGMKKEYENVISDILGVKPIKINSNLVSAQNRKRLYWTNIPNVVQPEDKKIILADILDSNESSYSYWSDAQMTKWHNHEYVRNDYYRIEPLDGKVQCLMAQMGMNAPKIWYGNRFRWLTALEWEKLQTVPENYTSSISESQRKKCLGNGWTVDVIAHIFSFLPEEFKNG